MKNNLTIRKIPVDVLLDLLTNLYNQGVDYVDLIGDINDEIQEDKIGIAVYKEYMSEESDVEELVFPGGILSLKLKEGEDNNKSAKKLSEEDLNKLL